MDNIGGMMQRKTMPIVLISILLGLGFDRLIYSQLPGISVFIYTSLILGFTFYLTTQFRRHINRSIYWLAPVISFFSLMIFVRANLFLAFINVLLIIYLLLIVNRKSGLFENSSRS